MMLLHVFYYLALTGVINQSGLLQLIVIEIMFALKHVTQWIVFQWICGLYVIILQMFISHVVRILRTEIHNCYLL